MDKPLSPTVHKRTAAEIDRRFADLESFARSSWSNLAIVEKVQALREDVRAFTGLDDTPDFEPVHVDLSTRWG